MSCGFRPILEIILDTEHFMSDSPSVDAGVPLIGPKGSLNQQQPPECYLKPGIMTGRTLSAAVYGSSSCFTLLPMTDSLRPFHVGYLSLIKRETPFLLLSLHPSLSLSPGPLHSNHALQFSLSVVQRLACFCLHHLCNAFLHTLPRGEQPCCLPLTAKILEGDVCSPLPPQPLIYSASIYFTPACAGDSMVNKTPWPCSHEAYNRVGKTDINY